jgi:outer membrane protein assembly factor BamB
MKRILVLATALIAIWSASLLLKAGDWPGWRGPQRTDVSTESGLLKSWGDKGPTQLWSYDNAGLGYGGPAVVGKQMFLLGTRKESEVLIAIDVANGKERWATPIGSILNNGWGNGPRSTPAVDGNLVYAMGGRGNLLCANTQTGKMIWQVSMTDFGGRVPGWGYTESVLIDGDRLLCTPGGSQGAILALEKKTGKKIWQSSDFTDGAQYSSIIVAEHAGQRQYIQLTMKNVAGVAADSGKLLWKSSFPGRTAVVPTPIYHDSHVYVSSGYGAGCKLVQLDDNNQATEVYSNSLMKNHHGGVLRVDNFLYGYSDGAGWVCQDFKTGEKVWNDRNFGKGSLTYADGMLYCLTERDGTIALFEVSATGWQEKGRFQMEPQATIRSPRGRIWTHPVVANGKLYLRDQNLVFCYDIKQP